MVSAEPKPSDVDREALDACDGKANAEQRASDVLAATAKRRSNAC